MANSLEYPTFKKSTKRLKSIDVDRLVQKSKAVPKINTKPKVSPSQAVGGSRTTKNLDRRAKNTPRNDQPVGYKPYHGKIELNYRPLAGRGPTMPTEQLEDVANRRKEMLKFSSIVNSINREVLSSQSPKKDHESMLDSIFARSSMPTNSNSKLINLRERRNKAMKFARSIKRPKVVKEPGSGNNFDEERFVEYDNNQYLLENQKIKMLY